MDRIRSQELRRSFLFYVKNRDLSFQFPPVKLSSGVAYGKVVSKSIATAEMVYFDDRHASARRVIENKSHREFEALCPDSIPLGK